MNTMLMIPIDLIDPHPHNPRRDLGDLTEMAKSIEAQGIRQNLLIVPQPGPDFHPERTRYTTVIGHRRLAAAQIACLTEVPCVIDPELDEAGQIELMLLENLQRKGISPIEEAEGYQQLLDLGVKPKDIVKMTGRSATTVHARLQLLKLPTPAQEKVHTNQASLEDAAELVAFEGSPAELERVTQALGTDNFEWTLKQARKRIALDEKMAPLYAEAERLGATRGTASWSTHNTLGSATTLEEVAGHAPFPEGTIYTAASFSPRLHLYSPKSDEEIATANAGGTSTAVTDEQRAVWAEERRIAAELHEQITAEGVQAAELRDEWIRNFVGRKRILAKESLAIVAATSPRILLSDSCYVEGDLANWLGLEDGDWDDEDDVLKALDADCPSGDRSLCLLILLHLSTRNYYWGSAHSNRELVALYALLEHLGYPVSDVERARLAPDADEATA